MSKIRIKTNVDDKQQYSFHSVSCVVNSIKTTEGGVPLNESKARYGSFVMNIKGEIPQAVGDYRSGKMGEIAIQ